jgi:cyclic pyranopterin phosphate synthase
MNGSIHGRERDASSNLRAPGAWARRGPGRRSAESPTASPWRDRQPGYDGPVEDRFGHRISYLRLSITDRCNERCRYCLPEERQEWLPREGVLSYEEIVRVTRVAATLGVRKLRVTGGEPLVRRGVIGLIRELKAIPGIDDIGLSTNGTLLAAADPEGGTATTTAQCLAAAGVRTVNVSLDTLDRSLYAHATGRDFLPKVLAGLEAARAAGFARIKLNCVLMRGTNEDALADLADFAHEHGHLLRFIELMPVSRTDVLHENTFLGTQEARRRLEDRFGPLTPRPDFRTNGPASYFEIPGRGQLVGLIGAMTNLHFCESCNKLRLTCDGKLRPCLGSHLEFDLLGVLRAGATDAQLADFFRHVVDRKPKEHDFRDGYLPQRHMTAIGG